MEEKKKKKKEKEGVICKDKDWDRAKTNSQVTSHYVAIASALPNALSESSLSFSQRPFNVKKKTKNSLRTPKNNSTAVALVGASNNQVRFQNKSSIWNTPWWPLAVRADLEPLLTGLVISSNHVPIVAEGGAFMEVLAFHLMGEVTQEQLIIYQWISVPESQSHSLVIIIIITLKVTRNIS